MANSIQQPTPPRSTGAVRRRGRSCAWLVTALLLGGCHGGPAERASRGASAVGLTPVASTDIRLRQGATDDTARNGGDAAQAAFHKGKLLVREDFDRDLSRWTVEKHEGDTVELRNGKLLIDAGAGVTVWLATKLEAPVMVQYDVKVVDRGGAHDRVSDVDCFVMAEDPRAPDDLFSYTPARDGNIRAYDALRLYYVGYGANGNTTTRFRRYPGDGTHPLLPEHDLRSEEFLLTPNKQTRFEIAVFGERVQFLRDGEMVFDIHDASPFHEGWFALRTVDNHMVVDNVRVWRLDPRREVDR